jgi:hypothetical protein
MEINQIDAVNASGHGTFEVSSQEQRNTPFMYSSVMDQREPFGYTTSDMKELYLSRSDLQARMVAPEITQEEILKFTRQGR